MRYEINIDTLSAPRIGLLLMTLTVTPLSASDVHIDKRLLLTDFAGTGSDLGWHVVNDNVMGGRSEGAFELVNGDLSFTGRTNTNGGGFSSIRTKPLRLDLSAYAGIRLKVRGDGRQYTWRLSSAERWHGRPIGYWSDFETRRNSWSLVSIPFSSFIPKSRGKQLEGPALDTRRIGGMGLMIYDKQDGPFELRLASVHAYPADASFSLMQYQWKNRILVVSATSEDDDNLRKQQIDVAAALEEFASRDMVLVTLIDGAVSKAGNRELTTREVGAARATLGVPPGSFALRLIGKDGSVKFSGKTAVPMSEIYALIDSMPMRQRETQGR